MWYINNVRFDNDRRRPNIILIGVEGGNRSVIHQAVVPAYDAEADDVAFLIKDLKSLHAVSSGQTRDDPHFTDGPHVPIATDDVAALDEVFVCLRVIEATEDGPNGGDWGGDMLDHGGATLVWANGMSMMSSDGIGDLSGTWYWCTSLQFFTGGGGGGGGCRSGGGIDSLE